MTLPEIPKPRRIRGGRKKFTQKMRNYISYCERFYFMNNGGFPSVEQAALALNLTQAEITTFLEEKIVQDALTKRGLPWQSVGSRTGRDLTGEQIATAITVMNFADDRSLDEKLEELGVLPQQYYAWLEDPVFHDFLTRRANKNLAHARPEALTGLAQLIKNRDFAAIKFYLEATGEFGNHQQEIINLKVAIQKLIEIVQTHIKDPTTLAAIAQDILKAIPNVSQSVEVDLSSRQLEGTTSEDRIIEALRGGG